MIQTFLVIYPDGSVKSFCCEKEDRLQAFYKIIDCDCVEQVRTILRDVVLIIDESGKVKDPPQPVNLVASQLYYGFHCGLDTINGPAIIAKLQPVGPDYELDWCELSISEQAYMCMLLGVSPCE